MTEGLTLQQRAIRVERKLLKQKPLTGGELAQRAGFTSGQAISRPLGLLKEAGLVKVIPGRKPRYLAS